MSLAWHVYVTLQLHELTFDWTLVSGGKAARGKEGISFHGEVERHGDVKRSGTLHLALRLPTMCSTPERDLV